MEANKNKQIARDLRPLIDLSNTFIIEQRKMYLKLCKSLNVDVKMRAFAMDWVMKLNQELTARN